MLQLQQLGLPLGFRSKVKWWQDVLVPKNHHYAIKKEYPRGTDCYENRNT